MCGGVGDRGSSPSSRLEARQPVEHLVAVPGATGASLGFAASVSCDEVAGGGRRSHGMEAERVGGCCGSAVEHTSSGGVNYGRGDAKPPSWAG